MEMPRSRKPPLPSEGIKASSMDQLHDDYSESVATATLRTSLNQLRTSQKTMPTPLTTSTPKLSKATEVPLPKSDVMTASQSNLSAEVESVLSFRIDASPIRRSSPTASISNLNSPTIPSGSTSSLSKSPTKTATTATTASYRTPAFSPESPPKASDLINQLAHERLRYTQLATSFDEMRRAHAELQANFEDYQEFMGALEVQCQEGDHEKARLGIELENARREATQLRQEVDALNFELKNSSQQLAPSVSKQQQVFLELQKEVRIQKRMLEEQSNQLVERDQEVQSLRRQLEAYQRIRRQSSIYRGSSSSKRSVSPVRRRQSAYSDSNQSFATAADEISPDRSMNSHFDELETFAQKTQLGVEEKLSNLASVLSEGKPASKRNRSASPAHPSPLREDEIIHSRTFVLEKCRSIAYQITTLQKSTLDGNDHQARQKILHMIDELSRNIEEALRYEGALDRAVAAKNSEIHSLRDQIVDFESQKVKYSSFNLNELDAKVQHIDTPSDKVLLISDLEHDRKLENEATLALVDRNRELQAHVDLLEEELSEAKRTLTLLEQDRAVIKSYKDAFDSLQKKTETVTKNRQHELLLEQTKQRNELLASEVVSLTSQYETMQKENDKITREKNKAERSYKMAQESIDVIEAQKLKLENLLKSAEGVVVDRDRIIRGFESKLKELSDERRSSELSLSNAVNTNAALKEQIAAELQDETMKIEDLSVGTRNQMLSDMNDEREELRDKIDSLQKENRRLEKTIEDLRDSLDLVSNQFSTLKALGDSPVKNIGTRNPDIEATVGRLKLALEEKEVLVSRLMSEKQSVEAEVSSLKKLINARDDELRHLQLRMDTSNRTNTQLEKSFSQSNSELENLKISYDRVKKELELARSGLNLVESLQNQVENLEEQLAQSQSENSTLKEQLMIKQNNEDLSTEKLRESLKQKVQELSNQQSKLSSLHSKYEVSVNKIKVLESELTEQRNKSFLKISELQSDIASKDQALSDALDDALKARHELDETETRFEALSRANADCLAELSHTKQSLSSSQIQASELRRTVDLKVSELSRYKSVQLEVDHLRSKIAAEIQKSESYMKDLEIANFKSDEYCRQSNELKDQIAHLEHEIGVRQQQHDVLCRERDELKDRLEAADRRAEAFETLNNRRNSAVQQDFDSLRDEVNSLKAELKAKEKLISELSGSNLSLRDQISELQVLVDQYTAEISHLAMDKDSLNAAILANENDSQKLREELSKLNRTLSNELDQKKIIERKHSELISAKESESTSLKSFIENLKSSLAIKADESLMMEKQVQSLKGALSVTEDRFIAEKENMNKIFNSKTDELKKTVEYLEKALSDSRHNQDLAAENSHIKDRQIMELQKELNDLRIDLEKEISSAKSQEQTLSNEIKRLKNEISNSQKQMEVLSDSKEQQLTSLFDGKEQECNRLKVEVTTLHTTCEEYAKKIDLLVRRVDEVEKELRDKAFLVDTLEQKVLEYDGLLNAKTTEVKSLKTLLSGKSDMLTSVSDDISKLETELRKTQFQFGTLLDGFQTSVFTKLSQFESKFSLCLSHTKILATKLDQSKIENRMLRSNVEKGKVEMREAISSLTRALQQSAKELEESQKALILTQSNHEQTKRELFEIEQSHQLKIGELEIANRVLEQSHNSFTNSFELTASEKTALQGELSQRNVLLEDLKSKYSTMKSKLKAAQNEILVQTNTISEKNTEINEVRQLLQIAVNDKSELIGVLQEFSPSIYSLLERSARNKLVLTKEQFELVRQELQSLVNVQNEWKNEMNNYEMKVAHLQNETNNYRAKCAEFEDLLNKRRKIILELEKANKEMHKTVRDYESAIGKKESEISVLQSDLAEQSHRSSALPEQVEALTAKLNSSERSRNELEYELKAIKDNLQALEAYNYPSIVHQLEAKINASEREINSLREKLVTSEANLSRSQQDANAKIADLSSEVQQRENESFEIKNDSAVLIETNSTLKSELELKKGEAVLLKLQLDELSKRLETSNKERGSLESMLRDLESRSADALTKMQNEVSSVSQQYTKYEQINTELLESNDGLRNQLESATNAYQQVQVKYQSLLNEKESLSRELAALQAKNVALDQSVVQLTETIAEMQLRKETSSSGINSVTAKKLELIENEFTVIKERDEKIVAENRLLKQKLNALKSNLEELQREYSSNQALQGQLRQELAQKQQSLEELITDNRNLREEKNEMDSKFYKRFAEVNFVREQLSAVAGALRDDQSEYGENGSDTSAIRISSDDLRTAIGLPEPRPLEPKLLLSDSQSRFASIANLSLPEIIAHYEKKFQILQQLLEQSDNTLKMSTELLKSKDEKRRKRKLKHSRVSHEKIRMF